MEQAVTYLQTLDNKTKYFLFACYDYRKIKKGRQIYGAFNNCLRKLTNNNNEGFDVYVTVNETTGPARKKENIKRCRAIWVEDDNKREAPRTDFPIKPSMVVQSSPGKYHYYWLTSTTKFEEWDAVMQTMVDKWGCDPQARDISRVMRLPGFKHRKDLKSDIVCQLIESEGTIHSWLSLKSIFPPSKKIIKTDKEEQEQKEKTGYSEKDAMEKLLNSENYHGSLVSISMSLTNKDVSRELQYMTLFGLMHKIPKDKRRPEWEHRVSEEHLYECIDTAINKLNKEREDAKINLPDDFDPDWILKPKEVPFPPGLMGKLCEEILEMAPYPNREIALAGAIGLVAGITGRAFNVLGMGLNVYIAILADSGIGKANLKDSVNIALRGAGPYNVGATFIGRSRFTGPKAIFDMLSKGMSRICIIEEAGLMSESKAGDQSGITRALLDLFTSSGYGKWAGDEGYSSKDDSIPALHSPALSIVNVSTPKSFLSALKAKSADVSGEVARLWMMRSIGEKPYLNTKRRRDFGPEMIKQLGLLIKESINFQQPDSELDPREIEIPESFYEDANKWVDRENNFYREGNHLKRTLCSRAWAKIIKLSAIVSLFNGKTTVGEAEYRWAEASILTELNTISDSFAHESSDDLTKLSVIVAAAIYKSVKQKMKEKKKNSSDIMSKNNCFTYYAIGQILRNNTVLSEIDDDPRRPNPRTGLDKVLSYMITSGYITKLSPADVLTRFKSRSKLVFQITEEFVKEFVSEQ